MVSIDAIRKKLEEFKPFLKTEYNIESIGIFGSCIKGQAGKNSDQDILVDFSEVISLLKFIHLENELPDKLGVKVDLVMKSALKPRIGKHILKEVVYL